MTSRRLIGAALFAAFVFSPIAQSWAQSPPTDEAPTAPTVPPTATIAGNVMPAQRADLDKAAAQADFRAINTILGTATNLDALNRNMDWEELQIVQGGSLFYSFRYVNDLWLWGTKVTTDPNAPKMKLFAGVMALYALQQIQIDRSRCVDPSAPAHRMDQLTAGQGALWTYVLGLPEITRRDLAVEALKLEARTAKLRRDDPVLCSGGVADMVGALKDDKAPLDAQSGGRREIPMTPHPAYVDLATSAPEQAKARAAMPLALARLLKLPEGQPK